MADQQKKVPAEPILSFRECAIFNVIGGILIFLFLLAQPIYDWLFTEHDEVWSLVIGLGTLAAFAVVIFRIQFATEETESLDLPGYSRFCYIASSVVLCIIPVYGLACLLVSLAACIYSILRILFHIAAKAAVYLFDAISLIAHQNVVVLAWDWLTSSAIHVGIAALVLAIVISLLTARCVTNVEHLQNRLK